jgi:serine/threonine protein phosphatase PrpC
MKYDFFAKTDPGKMRDNNEDSVASDPANGLAVLADGMGGYNAGEIASGMATAFIKADLGRWLSEVGQKASPAEIRRAMSLCVDKTNQSIFNSANSNPQYNGMGTTLVVGVFRGQRLMLGHIGDSRCYRLRKGELMRLTRDHSLLQEQLDAGLITPEQAATSTNKNLVTRALGVEDAVLVEVSENPVEIDDIYMMCSDGLSDMVRDEAIAEILRSSLTIHGMADRLVAAANAAGGRDNISVLLVKAGVGGDRRSIISRLLGK